VRPTIVVELAVMRCEWCSRCEAHEVEARGSCCGTRWKEVELSCGARWRGAIRVSLRGFVVVGCGADSRSEGGTRRWSGVDDGARRRAVVAMFGDST
jgi:hypothetical protein